MLYLLLLPNLIVIALYGLDKYSATHCDRRIPENALHLFGLLAVWPVALQAQQLFRYKTSKTTFRNVFCLSVLLNGGALGWLHLPEGREVFTSVKDTIHGLFNQLEKQS